MTGVNTPNEPESEARSENSGFQSKIPLALVSDRNWITDLRLPSSPKGTSTQAHFRCINRTGISRYIAYLGNVINRNQ